MLQAAPAGEMPGGRVAMKPEGEILSLSELVESITVLDYCILPQGARRVVDGV